MLLRVELKTGKKTWQSNEKVKEYNAERKSRFTRSPTPRDSLPEEERHRRRLCKCRLDLLFHSVWAAHEPHSLTKMDLILSHLGDSSRELFLSPSSFRISYTDGYHSRSNHGGGSSFQPRDLFATLTYGIHILRSLFRFFQILIAILYIRFPQFPGLLLDGFQAHNGSYSRLFLQRVYRSTIRD